MKKFNSNLTSPLIEDYILEKTSVKDGIIDKMHNYAEENEVPIIGPLVGKYLYQITKITRAKNIFEMGSGFGYSAYWFAKAFSDPGKVICTEYSEAHKFAAEGFFKKAGYEHHLDFICGDSIEILKNSDEKYDIIFVDPPFAKSLVAPTLAALEDNKLVHSGSVVYLEHESALTTPALPAHWQIIKDKQTSALRYMLIEIC